MDFEALFADAVLVELTDATVRIASLDHLIAIKRAAGRPQDLEDVMRLMGLAGIKKT